MKRPIVVYVLAGLFGLLSLFQGFMALRTRALLNKAAAVLEIPASELHRYGMIHVPASGCPAGFTLVQDVFDREGKKYPACVRSEWRAGSNGIDYLMPGERIVITPIDPPKPKDTRGRL